MGNSQSAEGTQFVKAVKLQQEFSEHSLSCHDLTHQIEQVFGINSIPVSHRADIAESIARSVSISVKEGGFGRGREYEQRISNLETEILYLKSIIEESKYRSRSGSPVRSEIENDESGESGEIQHSSSRLSRTYFQSHSEESSNSSSLEQ